MGIGSSALGDGRGQGMLIRSPHGWKTGQPFQAGLPVNANWTGHIPCPLKKFWWGKLELDSPLAGLACTYSRSRYVAGMGLGQTKSIHDR